MNLRGFNFRDVIDFTLSYICSQTLDDLLPFQIMKLWGTSTHRLRARGFKESIHINWLPNAYHFLLGDTSMNTQRNPAGNVTLNYLEALVYELEVALMPLEVCSSMPDPVDALAFCLSECPFCCMDVGDIPIVAQFVPPKGTPHAVRSSRGVPSHRNPNKRRSAGD